MEGARPICGICLKRGDNMKLFDEQTLVKCKSILKLRQDYTLNYNSVRFSSSENAQQGYHAACYHYFTALSQKYREELKKQLTCGICLKKRRQLEIVR